MQIWDPDCIAYFKFNGNANDACTSDSITLSLNGGSDTSSAGKMGNGLTLNGVKWICSR